MTLIIMPSIVKLIVGYAFSVIYAQCYIRALYAEYHHAECRYGESRYAECRGAKKLLSWYLHIKLRTSYNNYFSR
jgi:hypothetical protein